MTEEYILEVLNRIIIMLPAFLFGMYIGTKLKK